MSAFVVLRSSWPLRKAAPSRLRPGGFPGLARMIVEQQISVAAAAAIWARVQAGLPELTPHAIMALDDPALALGVGRLEAHYFAHQAFLHSFRRTPHTARLRYS